MSGVVGGVMDGVRLRETDADDQEGAEKKGEDCRRQDGN